MLKQLLLFVFSFSITLSYGNNFKSDLIKPPSLKKGDTILIVAPAGKLKNLEAIQAGIDLAEQWGLVVKLGKYVLGESNSFSGTDQERLDDFQKGLDNPNIKMIWAGRGGYGAVRIIDDLDFTTTSIESLDFGGNNSDWYMFTGVSLIYTFGRPPCYTKGL